jgi:ferrous iron transport protein B
VQTVLLTGLPNSGKTHLFNDLTGTYDIEANYAYTTMEFREEKFSHAGISWRLVDSPGFHGLYIHSEEEILLRDYIFKNKPDILLHCIDSGRISQGLLLALDLADLGIPMIVVINNIDNTNRAQIKIDREILSRELKVPLLEFDSFSTGWSSRVGSALKEASPMVLDDKAAAGSLINSFLQEWDIYDLSYKRVLSRLILQKDETLKNSQLSLNHGELDMLFKKGEEYEFRNLKGDFNTRLLEERQGHIDRIIELMGEKKEWTQDLPFKLAAISRHPLYGIPFLLITLLLGYFLVVNLAGAIDGVLSRFIFDPFVLFLDRLIGNDFLRNLLLGEYGIITLGVVAALVTVLPVLTVFFFFFAIIEDTGYLPNLMVLLRKSGEKIGLSGKSLMPLLLGFGCKTMATLSTKSISSRREKLIAVFLIGFAIPCSAQMGLNMAILGRAGVIAFLVAFLFLLIVETGAGFILNRILPEQNNFSFIQELPPFRLPRLGAILRKTGFRIINFLKESLLVFIIAAFCLYLLDLTGMLLILKNLAEPIVVYWLGLPIDMVEGLLLILARNEAGAGYILQMANGGELTVRQTILAVVLTTMFVPCFANMVAMVKETGKKTGLLMILAINISSLILAGGLNFLLQLIWKGAN